MADETPTGPDTPEDAGGGSPFDSGEFFAPGGTGPAAPTRIGPYEIIRPVGRGGMGVVYLARRSDGQFRQLVALKIARVGVDSEEYLQRFKREREVLYGLNHPNIARVLDGGATEDGQPYFVMEYVEGERIDQYCDDQRLTTAERLALFAKVCDAIRYCHQNLVVHRDLKPANILVTADGEPKILDFGIAKLLDPGLSAFSDETAPSLRLMTFAYASPEQVRGTMITPSSDIYSLGVLLYELLTGRMPYNLGQQVRAKIEDVICNVPPEPPSTAITKPYERRLADGTTSTVRPEELARLQESKPTNLRRKLSGDIDDIVMVALAKSPRLRYASVEQMQRDVEAHLEGRPVEARRIRRSVNWSIYAARRFGRRHRVGLVALAAAMVALSVGLLLALWQWREAESQRLAAEAAEARTRALATTLIEDLQTSVLPLPGSVAIRGRLLDLGLAELDRLVDLAPADDAEQLLELASGYDRMGDVAAGFRTPHRGDLAAAEAAYREAQGLRERAAIAGAPDESIEVALAESELRLGDVRRERGENGAAVELYERSEARLTGLAQRGADAELLYAKVRIALANALNRQDLVDRPVSRDERDRLLRGAEADMRALLAASPSEAARTTLANALLNRGADLMDAGSYAEALPLLRESVRIRSALFEERPTDAYARSQLSASQLYAGRTLMELAREDGSLLGEGTELLGRARGHDEFLLEADPADERARLRLGGTLQMMGRAHHYHDFAVASGYFRESVEVGEAALARQPDSVLARRIVGFSNAWLGRALTRIGRLDEAIAAHAAARERFTELLTVGDDRADYADALADVLYAHMYTLSRVAIAARDAEDEGAAEAVSVRVAELERAIEQAAASLEGLDASAAPEMINEAIERVRGYQTTLASMRENG